MRRDMSKKLFVGSLSWDTKDEGLRNAFAVHGEITEAVVVCDRDTGRSRGFGFVTFSDDESARNAISGMDGKQLDGRTIKVISDRDTGRSRGFGFVTFEDDEAADKAIAALNGTELDGRNIRVDVAQAKQRGGGGGGGRRDSGDRW